MGWLILWQVDSNNQSSTYLGELLLSHSWNHTTGDGKDLRSSNFSIFPTIGKACSLPLTFPVLGPVLSDSSIRAFFCFPWEAWWISHCEKCFPNFPPDLFLSQIPQWKRAQSYKWVNAHRVLGELVNSFGVTLMFVLKQKGFG